VTAGGEEPVAVGDETDQQEPGDQDEGRPVLGCGRPGVVGGEENGDQDEGAAPGGRPPAQCRSRAGRAFLRPAAVHGWSVPHREGVETTVAQAGRAVRPRVQAAVALTSVVSSAPDSAFQSAQ
jgi:hypothetical protein